MNPDLEPSTSVREAESILEQLAATALDDDYYVTHEHPPGAAAKTMTAIVLAMFGLLITVAAAQTTRDRPATEVERAGLIEDIGVRRDLVSSKQNAAASLKGETAELEAGSSIDSPATKDLLVSTGAVPVVGPGMTITVESSPNTDDENGRLTNSDLQLIVNGLWFAGADAVSINGHRLASTSAIRSAGEAITVNYRSVTEPIVVSAIGDEDKLVEQWLKGPSGRYLKARADTDNLSFRVRGSEEISLPRAPQARMKVSAKAIGRSDQ
ncbi:MAG TPA: DUF881 domain-containing protein [Aeromicrobium sp.]|nr:DUF881 domain-containing protein [Aeromicrobium sp.]